MSAPTVRLDLSPYDARLLRLCLAHQALGVRYWSEMPGEEGARSQLQRMRAVQHAIEDALRESGHTVHPGGEA